jgi:hypothetical protein
MTRAMGAGAAIAVAALLVLGLDATAQGTKKPSACKGLDEKACTAKAAECAWVRAKKVKPYCRTKPATKKKT